MLKSFLSVGAWTLLSRVTGFVRDVLMAQIMGAGLLTDAFTVAFRLPNHFRAIFAEGAFNTAFVPVYSRILSASGPEAAGLFLGRMLSIVLVVQAGLLGLALLWPGLLIDLLAPGFAERPAAQTLATGLLRLTFPYLLLVTLVTLWAGALNATGAFIAGAAAPVLLNIAMIVAVLAAPLFPTPAHAAAAGVFAAGVLEAGLLAFGAFRSGLLFAPRLPRRDGDTMMFLKAFGPAVIGSAGVQIAMFADTILVTFLPTGGASALYFADRLYQLPIGVIGIAAGTVLLPRMSALIGRGDEAGAHGAQNQALALIALLSAPFVVAFLIVPHEIVRGVFGRGAFDARAAAETAAVLGAYGTGLAAILALRAIVPSFHARSDTTTPMLVALGAIALNVGLKIVLWRDFGAAGLAFATSAGAWANLLLLAALALRQRKAAPDRRLFGALGATLLGAGVMAGALLALSDAVMAKAATLLPAFPQETGLLALALLGAASYGAATLIAFKAMRVPLPRR